ncbi:MAG TPA: hypothetical protein VHM24_07860 [Gemmatimonadaceae bacterium]|nr:hypothetical protein [Gemmatimonadaceae bacterium]
MPFTPRLIITALSFAAMTAPCIPAFAQTTVTPATPTADDLIARYLNTVGGPEKMQAIKSLRRVGKYTGSGGFEAIYIQENKRPDWVREEFVFQGMTAVNAWDGKTGWKIDPFQGKKDAESLSEEEMRSILIDADFDEPIVDYAKKGNKVAFAGMDQIEGTDVYKVNVTLKNGDTRTYYLDTDSYVPIKIDDKRTIRGSEQEIETILGDYKQVEGWFIPFSIESGRKGDQQRGKINWERVEANVNLDDVRFRKPEGK